MGAAAGAHWLVGLGPAHAMEPPAGLVDAVRAITGGAALHEGGLRLEIAELVENGNAVPLRVALLGAAASGADPVHALWLLSERNPAPEVLTLRWPQGWPVGATGPLPVATRIRLATSQAIVALAQARSGRWWHARADVIVTLAACVEG
jgi:sulfur-oxidizing protein SoxY